MRRQLLFAIFIGCFAIGKAQMLDTETPLFKDAPFFHSSWIKNHGVKRIFGKVSFKRDGQPIRNSMLQKIYEFNANGELVFSSETIKIKNRIDTVIIHYEYTPNGLLQKKIRNDAYGYYSENYIYDKSNLMIGKYHSREKWDANLGFQNQNVVWKDSISNEKLLTGEIKKQIYNSNGSAYVKEVISFDQDQNIQQIAKYNLIGGTVNRKEIKRNEHGLIVRRKESSTLEGSIEWINEIGYDQDLRFEKEVIKRNGQLLNTRKITYNNMGLMNLHLLRNNQNGEIEIIEYTYSFY